MLSGACGNLNATAIIRSTRTLEDAGNLLELATNLNYHLLSSAAHCLHCQTAEQEGCHSTDEGTYEHFRVHQVYLEEVHEVGDSCLCGVDNFALNVGHRRACTLHGNLNFLNVGSQQS